MSEELKPRKESVSNVFKQAKDVASLEVMKPVLSRVRTRLKELEKLSKAVTTKIMRGRVATLHTKKPQMFISGLDASIKNGVGVITYHVYEQDEDGNKKLYREFADMQTAKGETYKKEVNAYYKHEKLVIETIEPNKPLKTENFAAEVN